MGCTQVKGCTQGKGGSEGKRGSEGKGVCSSVRGRAMPRSMALEAPPIWVWKIRSFFGCRSSVKVSCRGRSGEIGIRSEIGEAHVEMRATQATRGEGGAAGAWRQRGGLG